MDDDLGEYVESVEEGYELKSEQIEVALQPLSLPQLPIYFFNAYEDNSGYLREYLSKRLTAVRDSFREQLNETIEDTERLLKNHEQEQVQEVTRSAGKRIESWVKQHGTLAGVNAHVQDDLVNTINKAHACTVRATILRKGKWSNLDYLNHLGYGSRLLATKLLKENVLNFKDYCNTLAGDLEYTDAQDFIKQAEKTLSSSSYELLSKVELTGGNYFSEELESTHASPLWTKCLDEYGQGYRNRIVQHNKDWFNEDSTKKLEQTFILLLKGSGNQSLAMLVH